MRNRAHFPKSRLHPGGFPGNIGSRFFPSMKPPAPHCVSCGRALPSLRSPLPLSAPPASPYEQKRPKFAGFCSWRNSEGRCDAAHPDPDQGWFLPRTGNAWTMKSRCAHSSKRGSGTSSSAILPAPLRCAARHPGGARIGPRPAHHHRFRRRRRGRGRRVNAAGRQ